MSSNLLYIKNMTKNEKQAIELLIKVKAKVTQPRLAVLKSLMSNLKPISAQTIINQKKLDKATVYRILDFFIKNHLVKIIDLRQGKRLYEMKGDCSQHYIICTNCQKVEIVDICVFKQVKEQVLKKSHFKAIHDHSLEFFGLCSKCDES
jgi:Fur family transcriptional regulator, ferric uptake regulator